MGGGESSSLGRLSVDAVCPYRTTGHVSFSQQREGAMKLNFLIVQQQQQQQQQQLQQPYDSMAATVQIFKVGEKL